MLKAQQGLLVQNTNQILIAIRQFELDYFSNLFSTFGTLGAIMAGFAVNSIAQVLAQQATSARFWKSLYWISTCCCIAFGLHVMVTTAVIIVYGPGLALRGPLGSMKKAIDGMYYEQGIILRSTLLCIMAYAVELIAIFVLEMFLIEAWISCIMLVVASLCWYHSCLRIYNRFKIPDIIDTTEDQAWSMTDEIDSDQAYVPPDPAIARTRNESDDTETQSQTGPAAKSKPNAAASVSGKSQASTFHIAAKDAKQQKRTSKWGPWSGSKEKNDHRLSLDSSQSVSSDKTQSAPAKRIYKEGYLLFKLDSGDSSWFGGSSATKSSSWDRKFFVLNHTALWYYNDKSSYERSPKNPCNQRPLIVSEYILSDEPTGRKGTPVEYEFTMFPRSAEGENQNPMQSTGKLRNWKFRCDTLEELKEWVEVLETLAPRNTS